jgi:hypothetical protein
VTALNIPSKQSGRRHGKDAPYAKPSAAAKALSSRISDAPGGRGSKRSGSTNLNSRRDPAGTPDILKDRNPKRAQVHQEQHSKINSILSGEEIKQWIRSRNIQPGVLDMSVSDQEYRL